jgi:hypothetical protein
VSNLTLLSGRVFTDEEDQRHAAGLLLGYDTADKLFVNGEDPIGKEINVETGLYTVIGVLDKRKQLFGSGQNPQDNAIYFPMGTFHNLHPEVLEMFISAKYDDPANKSLVEEEMRELLRIRRKVKISADDNFDIFGTDSINKLWEQITGGLFGLMVAVSSVGLMVGGVGVMNIMLVSVTERTREIGIRKALGATKHTILIQFTTEAVTLCAVGGLIGVLLGAAAYRHHLLVAHRLVAHLVHRVGVHRLRRLLRHRTALRHLSRMESRQPRPHRSAQVRVNSCIFIVAGMPRAPSFPLFFCGKGGKRERWPVPLHRLCFPSERRRQFRDCRTGSASMQCLDPMRDFLRAHFRILNLAYVNAS